MKGTKQTVHNHLSSTTSRQNIIKKFVKLENSTLSFVLIHTIIYY